ncbi:MAG: HlyC/CorC family transporter [Deltaproteobacteria bacterium]|nr:HlyC/CorC family transporter [Deltaproteobacteria bacterium]
MSALVLFLILLGFSFFFSASEAALFSVSRLDLHRLAEENHPRARLLTKLLAHPRTILITVLICNELVNIGAAAVVTVIVNDVLRPADAWVKAIVSTAVFVPVLLLFGDIAPKSLAIRRPRAWALVVAQPIRFFSIVVTPFRVLLKIVADGLVRLLGGATRSGATFDEEAYRSLIDIGQHEGVLDESERELIHNVFEFGDKTIAEIMTTKQNIFSLSYSLPFAELIQRVRDAGYSRVPVYRGRPENIVGVLHAKSLIPFTLDPSLQAPSLADFLRRVEFVPDRTKAAELFRTFQKKRFQIAIVVDEYGAVSGLVTAEDLLEEVFGEIQDERDHEEASRAKRSPA